MAQYLLPPFGKLDPAKLEEYYDGEIKFNGQEIQIDLNFENDSIDPKQLDAVKKFIDSLSAFDKRNKEYIEQDYADEDADTVKTYVQHHLEEIDKDELSDIVDFDNESIDPEIQLMKALRLIRVGLYPDSGDQFAVFDYSIGEDLTNYLIVINSDENGNPDDITMES